MKKLMIFLLTAAVLATAGNAFATDPEIELLKQQMSALRRGSLQSNSGAADAINQLQGVQSELGSLKAGIDANSHMINSQVQRMQTRLSDMEARIGALEERLNIQGKQVTTAVSAIAPEAAKEAEMYQMALNQINNSEFIKSIATLRKFKKKFPKSSYIPNAQYWVGECYFAMRDYEKAIKELQVVVERYPRSDKVPSALLKQGYAFMAIDMESDGKVFLNRLIRKFPRSKEAKEAKERLDFDKKAKKALSNKYQPADGIPLAPGVKVPDKYR